MEEINAIVSKNIKDFRKLKENRKATSESWMWIYRSGELCDVLQSSYSTTKQHGVAIIPRNFSRGIADI